MIHIDGWQNWDLEKVNRALKERHKRRESCQTKLFLLENRDDFKRVQQVFKSYIPTFCQNGGEINLVTLEITQSLEKTDAYLETLFKSAISKFKAFNCIHGSLKEEIGVLRDHTHILWGHKRELLEIELRKNGYIKNQPY